MERNESPYAGGCGDSLTGYGNYDQFRVKAQSLLESKGCRYSVCYCDIKNFKYINDQFGYQVGDGFLRYWADYLANSLTESETFSRISGDNFVSLCRFEGTEQLRARFQALTDYLNGFPPFRETHYRVEMCCGVFVAEGEKPSLSAEEMLDRANIAQKSVKNLPGNQFAVYDRTMRERILREKELERRMSQALEDGEFKVYLQPKVDIQHDNVLAGAEALVRWEWPGRGMLSPGEFIPLFEKNGFVVQLDTYIVEAVCKILRRQLDAGERFVPISVNVSRLALYAPDFVDRYLSIKGKYGIPDGAVELEFTESIVFENHTLFAETVKRLKAGGFTCALDDFGSGYSALNVLKTLPMDVLKLDQLFFRGGTERNRDRAVISSVVMLARALEMHVVAEGVEEVSQVNFLRQIGCDYVQGFVYSKPIPAEELKKRLRQVAVYVEEPQDQEEPVPPAERTTAPVFGEQYRLSLEFFHGRVLEVDLESHVFSVVADSLNHRVLLPKDAERRLEDYVEELLPLVHPEDRAAFRQFVSCSYLSRAFFLKSTRLNMEYRVREERGGQYWWFSMGVAYLKNRGGGLPRALICIQNAQEQQQAMLHLAQAEEQLQSIREVLDNLPYMLYIVDLDSFELVYANRFLTKHIPEAVPGVLCHKALMKNDLPCAGCPVARWRDQGSKGIYRQLMENPALGEVVACTVTGIKWESGRRTALANCNVIEKNGKPVLPNWGD